MMRFIFGMFLGAAIMSVSFVLSSAPVPESSVPEPEFKVGDIVINRITGERSLIVAPNTTHTMFAVDKDGFHDYVWIAEVRHATPEERTFRGSVGQHENILDPKEGDGGRDSVERESSRTHVLR